ncbi:hypothetical protein V5O48_011762 [Marasmius crinis-equi]|uniref:VHS domain-containing protein n=1 Tax=Marasmius crinis-equi TaxID=585013 RepID=A0ABR3F4P7_9AGAR
MPPTDPGDDTLIEGELSRQISLSFLASTACEDWDLVLSVCRRASGNETNAKEAMRALRFEFEHGDQIAQFAAARLWPTMPHISPELLLRQSTCRKSLTALKSLLLEASTCSIVKVRVLNVLAAAALAGGDCGEYEGLRSLWMKVKPQNMPEKGAPLVTDGVLNAPFAYTNISKLH